MDYVDKETLSRMFGDAFTTCTALSEEELARYAELEIAGQEPNTQLPEISAHLDECPDCTGRYAELLAVLQAEARGEMPSAPTGRPFSLQFLSTPKIDLWSEVKETAHRLVVEVPIIIQRTMAAFGPLPATLAPCRVTVAVAASRDAEDMPTEIESLRIPNEQANLMFVLTPGPVDAGGEGSTLILQVEELQSGEPVGQMRVNLCNSQAQLLQSKTTAADGRVDFRGLAGEYILQCRRTGQTWDFPVKLLPDASSSSGD